MSRPLAAIDRFVFGSVPVHGMVVLRIMLGLALVGCYGMRAFEYELLYGADSVAWSPAFRSFCAENACGDAALVMQPLVEALSGFGPVTRDLVGRIALALVILSGVCVAVGFRSQIFGVLGLLLHLFFVALEPLSYWGWALMIVPFFAYLIASPAHHYFALDGWLARGRRRPPPVEQWMGSAWTLRLVQLHVCLMYGYSGLARLDHPGWLHGQMLFEALTNEAFSRFAIDWTPIAPLLEWVSYGVFLLEPATLVLLWVPRARTIVALLLIAMHVVLELTTHVGQWNLLMIGGLATFLPVPWLEIGFARLGARRQAAA